MDNYQALEKVGEGESRRLGFLLHPTSPDSLASLVPLSLRQAHTVPCTNASKYVASIALACAS